MPFLAAFSVISCSKAEATGEVSSLPDGSHKADMVQTRDKSANSVFVPGEAVIYVSEELAAAIEKRQASGLALLGTPGLDRANAAVGAVAMERVFPDAGEYEERTRAEGMHRFYHVNFDTAVSLDDAMSAFKAVDGVIEFEKMHRVTSMTVNDPMFNQLWGLNSNGKNSINVEPVWQYTMGNPDVIVCVVDTGIDMTHPDLKWNCATTDNYNFVRNSTTVVAGDHGSHVAGTIAGVGNNGVGVIGIAGGDYAARKRGVTLQSAEVFEGNSSARSFASAIKWGADHGAIISQNSWGWDFDYNGDGRITGQELQDALSATIDGSTKSAVDYFIKYAGCDNKGNQKPGSPMKGGVVVFAAGNDGISNGCPANYEPVIAVGATNNLAQVTSFSNYGPWVDICAPGQSIVSTTPDGTYSNFAGTSMACPHVSGVCALMASYFGGEGFTNADLEEIVISGANPNKISPYAGHVAGPYLDAWGAFKVGLEKYRRDHNENPEIQGFEKNNLEFRQWQRINIPIIITDPDGDALDVTMETEGRAKLAKSSTEDNVWEFTLLCEMVNDFTPKKAVITAKDFFGGEAVYEFTYTVLRNNAPEAVGTIPSKLIHAQGETVSLNVTEFFKDVDEEPLTFSAVTDNKSVVEKLTVENGVVSFKVRSYGLATITVTATDYMSAKARSAFSVLLRQSEADFDCYPNPVVNYLYLRGAAQKQEAKVLITSNSGNVILDRAMEISAFEPAAVDMRSVAPGQYNLSVEMGGKNYSQIIIKR